MIKWCTLFSVSIVCVWCLAGSADAEDICGDAVCDGVETCVSCADDCGECDPRIVEAVTIDSTTGDNPPGTESCQVMLHINQPGVRLVAVGNADISTDDPDGFFQHVFNFSPLAPSCSFIPMFPDLANFLYWIDIQAVVGRSYVRANDSCSVLETDNPASAPFWAWQSSEFDCPAHSAQGNLVMDEIGDIGYANCEQVSAAQYSLKTVDQAYELLTLIKTCEQDFTGLESIPDGKVGSEDLANLLGSWGEYSACNNDGYKRADFDTDERIGAADLAQLLGKWGPCRCYENSDCPSEECVPAPPQSFYDFECVPVE